MSTQADYTQEEWKVLVSAPSAAGLVISLSDLSGPIGLAKEAIAIFRGISDPGASSGELIKAIAESLTNQVTKPEIPDLSRESPEAMRQGVIDICKQAVDIVRQKSPAEGDEYARWLVTVAHKTAEASKEGGFLGFGGTLVSDEEGAAVKQLSLALGVS